MSETEVGSNGGSTDNPEYGVAILVIPVLFKVTGNLLYFTPKFE